jgi:hypothetical protein
MSRKDAKFSYAILAVLAVAFIAVLATLYADRVNHAQMAAKSVRAGTLPSGARSAPGKDVQAARTAAGPAASVSLSRTVKVQRHADTPSAGGTSGSSLTRSATTHAAQAAKPAHGQNSGTSLTRSASLATPQAANPMGAANGSRSLPKQAAQAAKPSASGASGAGLSRAASAQSEQAAQAAKPEGGQSAALNLARAAPRQAAQAASAGRDTRALDRSSPSEVSKAAQAPLALQRKWDPARTPEAPQTLDLQEL